MIIVILEGHEISINLADHRKFDDWILFWPKLFGDKVKSFSLVRKLGIFHEYARKHKLIGFIPKAYR
jgi:hypothetical protein